jgi:hypothetical protein
MTILTMLKRTTALAAVAALPLAPAAVQAESAQVTGTQPPSAEAQSESATAVKKDSAHETGDQQAGQANTAGKQAQTGQQTDEQDGGGQQTGLENVEEKALPGTDEADAGSGDPWVKDDQEHAAGQATGGQAGQSQTDEEERGPANEAGIVIEGKEGTQSGEAPDQAPTGDQTGLEKTPAEGQVGQQGQAGQQGAGTGEQAAAGQDEDALVAKVGDREIRRSDVLTVIGALPPQLQQQPPEMLIPIALDQLVMRELILQEAKEAGLESDPAVSAQGSSARDKEDAMVEAWLEKELGDAVTEEKVQQAYDTVKQQMGDQAPDVETVRPQIEQELREQAFLDLSRDLQESAEITLYGPDGQAVTQ